MRANVLSDPALAKHAGRFVWLSLDMEKAANQVFAAKYKYNAYPTFLVVDPDAEEAVYRWVGTADAKQIQFRFDEGEELFRLKRAGKTDSPLVRANALMNEGKFAEAAAAYEAALQPGAVLDSARPRAVEALILALSFAGQDQACAERALAEAPKLARDASFANVAVSGLGCALGADAAAPWRKGAITALEPLARESLSITDILGDDKAGIYQTLVGVLDDRGEKEQGTALAKEWLAFVENARSAAPNAEGRIAYDSSILSAALRAGEPARAIAPLEQSERDLPRDFNPPARIAIALREMGQLDAALVAIERALEKGYGPRRANFFETKAGLLERKGDKAAARKVLEEGIAYAQGLPEGQGKRVAERLKGRLAKLDAK